MRRFGAGTWAVFSFGLEGGEVVARSNSSSLADGQPVKPVGAKAEGEALKERRLVRAKRHGRLFHAIAFRLKVGRMGVSYRPIRASKNFSPWNSNLTRPFLRRRIRPAFHCSGPSHHLALPSTHVNSAHDLLLLTRRKAVRVTNENPIPSLLQFLIFPSQNGLRPKFGKFLFTPTTRKVDLYCVVTD
jgi:hypothetical protein